VFVVVVVVVVVVVLLWVLMLVNSEITYPVIGGSAVVVIQETLPYGNR